MHNKTFQLNKLHETNQNKKPQKSKQTPPKNSNQPPQNKQMKQQTTEKPYCDFKSFSFSMNWDQFFH